AHRPPQIDGEGGPGERHDDQHRPDARRADVRPGGGGLHRLVPLVAMDIPAQRPGRYRGRAARAAFHSGARGEPPALRRARLCAPRHRIDGTSERLQLDEHERRFVEVRRRTRRRRTRARRARAQASRAASAPGVLAARGAHCGVRVRLPVRALPFVLPLLFEVVLGYSAFYSGLLLLAMNGGDMLLKTLATRTLRRFGFRSVLMSSSVLTLAGIAASVV